MDDRDFQMDVLQRLARIEERLTERSHLLQRRGEVLSDHETRLRGIEKRQWLMAGGAAVLGAVTSFVYKHLEKYV